MRFRRAAPGMALATALFLIVLMLMLGLSLLTVASRDYRFANKQKFQQRAYNAARSGMEFARVNSDDITSTATQSLCQTPGSPGVPPDGDYYEVRFIPAGFGTPFPLVTSRGFAVENGKVMATATVFVENRKYDRILDAAVVGPP